MIKVLAIATTFFISINVRKQETVLAFYEGIENSTTQCDASLAHNAVISEINNKSDSTLILGAGSCVLSANDFKFCIVE